MESIVTDIKDFCIVCGSFRDIEIHHCIHGTSNRKNADKYGLTVPLCKTCHMGLHDRDTNIDLTIKRLAQKKFEEKYNHEKWLEVFGKSYL